MRKPISKAKALRRLPSRARRTVRLRVKEAAHGGVARRRKYFQSKIKNKDCCDRYYEGSAEGKEDTPPAAIQTPEHPRTSAASLGKRAARRAWPSCRQPKGSWTLAATPSLMGGGKGRNEGAMLRRERERQRDRREHVKACCK